MYHLAVLTLEFVHSIYLFWNKSGVHSICLFCGLHRCTAYTEHEWHLLMYDAHPWSLPLEILVNMWVRISIPASGRYFGPDVLAAASTVMTLLFELLVYIRPLSVRSDIKHSLPSFHLFDLQWSLWPPLLWSHSGLSWGCGLILGCKMYKKYYLLHKRGGHIWQVGLTIGGPSSQEPLYIFIGWF